MAKILVMVGIAIAVFMAFSAYSLQKAVQGRAHLTAIKDLYFPVLQNLDANVVRIDKLEEMYIQVVVTGDRDLLAKTAEVGEVADKAFVETARLYPGKEARISTLRADLKHYQKLASAVSQAFLDQSGADIAPMTTGMNDALATLRKDVTGFRQSSYDEFTATLAGSQRDARMGLTMGLALGVMNLGFMAVLVFFIRNNMKMMTTIEVQNATLEQRVAERTAQLTQKTSDINALLQNMKLGVSTVIPGNRIHPEYSNYLRTIFRIDDLAGKDLVESLFGNSSLGVDAKDQISVALSAILGEDAMMFDLNSHLLAQEMQITLENGKRQIVQMDWNPILGVDGNVEKVLLITQDVTHLRELEANAAQQKDELDIIAKILKVSTGKFNDFVASAEAFIAENRRLLQATNRRDPEVIAALFRNMHTIKGNARTYDFTHVTNAAHQAEQTYDQLRKDDSAPWKVDAIERELQSVAEAPARYVHVNEHTLGRKGRAADLFTDRGIFVAKDQLRTLRIMAGALTRESPEKDLMALKDTIDHLGFVSLERIVSGAGDALSSVASELHKPTPRLEISNGAIAFNNQFAETLKSCCMHLFRNSLDHGIEAPAARRFAKKPEQGTIRVIGTETNDHIEIRIEDDGRGLPLHLLLQKGRASGAFSGDQVPSRDEIAGLIFRSGLSTAAEVTQVSGRGVGMDAVRTFLAERGANIKIALEPATGTELGFTPFAFIIHVPASSYGH